MDLRNSYQYSEVTCRSKTEPKFVKKFKRKSSNPIQRKSSNPILVKHKW